ncbi:MAG: hypothetical protein FWF45_01460 [Coriobacteriia bacterium]|nr:hypothetical protein [Coriobacteriia bacterium]
MWKDLFSISWWRQAINSFTIADIHQRWSQIVAVFNNPRLNPVMFLMVIAVILVIVLILVLTVVMIISAVTSRQERYALVDKKTGKETVEISPQSVKAEAVSAYRKSWKRYYTVLVIIVGAFLVLLSVGAGTSTSMFCKACHGNDKKIAVMQSGSHKNMSCAQCHESGGTFARYTVNSFQRIGHLVTGFSANSHPTGYQTVPSSACLNCHKKNISQQVLSTNRGSNVIAVSHTEPLNAGMQCSRCHNMTTAQSPATSRGTMNTCLICHNGTDASDACATCHMNTPQVTMTSSGSSPDNADALITADPKTQCYTCHAADASRCDACHGLRLPHPSDFTQTHPAAVSRYGLALCFRCHNTKDTTGGEASGGAQPCTECHTQDPTTGKWDFQN